VLQVAAQVIGNDAAITIAGTGGLGGNFELNTMMPLIAYDLLQSIEILARVASSFDRDCVKGITANEDRMRELVERSLAMVTALVPRIGYDAATALAKEALSTGKTVREVALEKKLLPVGELDAALDPWRMTEGGIRGGE
jgi:fumarate hydratase class II